MAVNSKELQAQIDSRALEKATEALTRIAIHERSCDQRYIEISDGQKAIFRKLDNLGTAFNDHKRSQFTQWLVVAGGVIMTLLAVTGYLFARTQGWVS